MHCGRDLFRKQYNKYLPAPYWVILVSRYIWKKNHVLICFIPIKILKIETNKYILLCRI